MNDIAPWQSGEPLPDRPCARIIEDSVSPAGHRLTTYEAKMHRFVLAEFNTHRLFSRNSASSRAIPYPKQRDAVALNPAVPLSWPQEQSGMQGGGPLEDDIQKVCEQIWLGAMDGMVSAGNMLHNLDLHKSVINRLLEPFAWHTVLVTASEWRGFWAQRVSPLAQPEIHAVAREMDALYSSVPTTRYFSPHTPDAYGWHLPWIFNEERQDIPLEDLAQLSTARSCRVSYMTHNRVRSLDDDYNTFKRLENPGDGPPHASPFEHPAAVDGSNIETVYIDPTDYGIPGSIKTVVNPKWGNFIGWCQLRHMVFGDKP